MSQDDWLTKVTVSAVMGIATVNGVVHIVKDYVLPVSKQPQQRSCAPTPTSPTIHPDNPRTGAPIIVAADKK